MTLNKINELITKNFKRMKGMSIKITYSLSDADDLLQDTCIKLIANHDKYEHVKDSSFLNYVKVVMVRTHLNKIRKYKRLSEIKDLYDVYREITTLKNSISDASLLHESMIKYLKDPYELKVISLLLEGFTFKEIGSALNIPKNTVHTRHRAVKQRLRKELK